MFWFAHAQASAEPAHEANGSSSSDSSSDDDEMDNGEKASGFEEEVPGKVKKAVAKINAKKKQKADADKLKEMKQKADEKAKASGAELKDKKYELKVLDQEHSKLKERFRKFRNRNPGHKLTKDFKEVNAVGNIALKSCKLDKILASFLEQVPARFGADGTFEEVSESTTKLKSTVEEEKNFGTLCAHYNLQPFDKDIDFKIETFWKLGNHRRVPLSKAAQKVAIDNEMPEAAKFKYYVVGHQQR